MGETTDIEQVEEATDAAKVPTTPEGSTPPPLETPQSNHSIMLGQSGRIERVDSWGSKIGRGDGFEHKTSWKDEVKEGSDVVEIKEVRQWMDKDYKLHGSEAGCSLM